MAADFVYLTDTHHYPDAPEDYGAPKMLTRSQEVLDAVVPAINVLNPGFIVHGGDLLCGGGSFDLPCETYLRSIDEVSAAFSGFQSPGYYIPGNHDCDAQTGSYDEFAQRIKIPAILDVVDAAPGLRLALANIYHSTNPIEENNGTWTDELDDALRAAADQAQKDSCAVILIIHAWLIADDEVGRGVINNADGLLDTLSSFPALVAVFTGHRHLNRIQMIQDFLVVDTACLIGFPLGFRHVKLEDDGMFTTTFHQLDLPDLLQASYNRSTPEVNDRWQGQPHDRDMSILIPRLREIWG